LSKVQKLKRRISLSFGKLAISRGDDTKDSLRDPPRDLPRHPTNPRPYGTVSEDCLDRLQEENGNLPNYGWQLTHADTLSRQLSVSSDSKLLDEEAGGERTGRGGRRRAERPRSEAYLLSGGGKRCSAFGGDSPFGRSEAYVKLNQLGEGSYATVYKGFSNLTKQVVALKEIRLQEEEGAPFTAIREASLLKQLKHANIVTLHDIIHTRQTLTFVFEYVHTDLSQHMTHHCPLSTASVRMLLLQLLRGLAFCHARAVLHRDIKPQNLLISEAGELKIADFGLARAKSVPSHTYSHEVVTLWYRPPDVLLGSTCYTTSLDLWGVGCIFLEMVTGAPAFAGVRDVHDQLDKVFKVVGTPTEATFPGVSSLPQYPPHRASPRPARPLATAFPALRTPPHAEHLASRLLQVQPSARLSCEDALKHPYFEGTGYLLKHLSPERSVMSLPALAQHESLIEKEDERRGDAMIGQRGDNLQCEAVIGRGGG